MSLIHDMSALAAGGVSGLQAAQRDWSPFLVHFTSYAKMAPVRAAVGNRSSPAEIAELLGQADQESFEIVQDIAESGQIQARAPAEKDSVPSCVSLSECTLPGLIALSERYGRFGFVFRKPTIFHLGGRPCIYIDRECYGYVAREGRRAASGSAERMLFGLANVYCPPGFGQVQDYTHEREWRLFRDIALAETPPDFVISPSVYSSQVSKMFEGQSSVFSIDTMHEWGA